MTCNFFTLNFELGTLNFMISFRGKSEGVMFGNNDVWKLKYVNQ